MGVGLLPGVRGVALRDRLLLAFDGNVLIHFSVGSLLIKKCK